MACSGCSSGRGCHTVPNGVPAGCGSNGSCGTGGCNKLNVFDWLSNMSLPNGQQAFDIVEIRFKNSRKDFYKNVNGLSLNVGDVVAVEASPGHDIGVVSLTGELVRLQLKKKNIVVEGEEFKKIYRKAKVQDIEKWREAQELETPTMYKARTLALNLGLQMKISDVEYQGDRTKAIFYYTADGRVDFRELIKVMAEEFKVRIEMRQIGARQEAARLGAIGACGRELCCSTWLTDFRTVSTSAARYQQLSLNPLKLAGQCGKLKCCLNYELDSYLDVLKEFPEIDNKKLHTQKADAFHQKTDIFRKIVWYSYVTQPEVFIELSVARVKEIQDMNARGEKPEELQTKKDFKEIEIKAPDFENVVGQDSLTRFDRQKKQGSRKGGGQKPQGKGQGQGQQNRGQQARNQGQGQNRQQQPQQDKAQQDKPQQQNKSQHQAKPQGQGQQARNQGQGQNRQQQPQQNKPNNNPGQQQNKPNNNNPQQNRPNNPQQQQNRTKPNNNRSGNNNRNNNNNNPGNNNNPSNPPKA